METNNLNLSEEKIKNELVKQNVTEKVIKELQQRYSTLAEKICKAGREDAIKEQKLWVSKQKEISDKIKEIENHLQQEENNYDEEKKKILIDAQRTKQLPERKKQLAEIGIQIPDEDIKKYDDISWLTFINNEKTRLLKEKELQIKAQQELFDKEKKSSEISENKNNHGPIKHFEKNKEETDKDKLLIFASQIDNIIYPNVISKEAKLIIETIKKTFERTSKYIKVQSEKL